MSLDAGGRQLVGAIPADRDRAVGPLTAADVRRAVARFLTPTQVAELARAAANRTSTGAVLAELRAQWRGCAAGGVICTGLRQGLDAEIRDPETPGRMRAARIPWPLVAQVVADGTTTDRLAALETALTANRRAADDAATTIVLAGPAAIQLDLLDTLNALDEHAAPARR